MRADPSPPPVQSIAYATPAAHEPRRWFSLRTSLLSLVVVALVQTSFLLQFHFKPIFVDLHLKVPALTQMWLDAGDWWNAGYGWAIAWPLAVILPVGITFLRRRPQPGNARAKWLLLSNLALLALNFVFVLTAIAAYQPMVVLIEDISNSGGK